MATTPNLINRGQDEGMDVVGEWGMRLESSDKTLTKKRRLRICGNGEFVIRDCYDLVTVAEDYPDVFERALDIMAKRQRIGIAAELRSRKTVDMLGGRTLDTPRHPEWIRDLPRRATDLVEQGPPACPEPAPNPYHPSGCGRHGP